MKLNLGSGAHALEGFDNLDLLTGWRFEDGLGQYNDGSVEAITVSHALMYVPLEEWAPAFAEFARVLERGGVLRITEDATDHPQSERYGGCADAVTLTTAGLVLTHMADAGLEPRLTASFLTRFRDDSLIQTWHGSYPKVFHCEGVKR